MSSCNNLTEEDKDEIRVMFEKIDENKDGKITVEEMQKGLSAAGQEFSIKQVKKMIKKAGGKKTENFLEWEKFLELMSPYIRNVTSISIDNR